jgi:hypothetical protein
MRKWLIGEYFNASIFVPPPFKPIDAFSIEYTYFILFMAFWGQEFKVL